MTITKMKYYKPNERPRIELTIGGNNLFPYGLDKHFKPWLQKPYLTSHSFSEKDKQFIYPRQRRQIENLLENDYG